ncbi:MAG: hypothetical protein ABR929_02000 [Roseiarcus sp.]|jgi:hypothetical protein
MPVSQTLGHGIAIAAICGVFAMCVPTQAFAQLCVAGQKNCRGSINWGQIKLAPAPAQKIVQPQIVAPVFIQKPAIAPPIYQANPVYNPAPAITLNPNPLLIPRAPSLYSQVPAATAPVIVQPNLATPVIVKTLPAPAANPYVGQFVQPSPTTAPSPPLTTPKIVTSAPSGVNPYSAALAVSPKSFPSAPTYGQIAKPVSTATVVPSPLPVTNPFNGILQKPDSISGVAQAPLLRAPSTNVPPVNPFQQVLAKPAVVLPSPLTSPRTVPLIGQELDSSYSSNFRNTAGSSYQSDKDHACLAAVYTMIARATGNQSATVDQYFDMSTQYGVPNSLSRYISEQDYSIKNITTAPIGPTLMIIHGRVDVGNGPNTENHWMLGTFVDGSADGRVIVANDPYEDAVVEISPASGKIIGPNTLNSFTADTYKLVAIP